MNDPKFQFLYKGLPFTSTNSDFNWHKKVYFLSEFIDTNLNKLSDVHETSTLIATRQYIGMDSKSGSNVFVGDIVKCLGFSALIIWDKEESRFAFDVIGEDMILSLSIVTVSECEVIGNKYQNPEFYRLAKRCNDPSISIPSNVDTFDKFDNWIITLNEEGK